MSPNGHAIFLAFAVVSGLVPTVPPVRLLPVDDISERKLTKSGTDEHKKDEDVFVVIERQPRNAVAGKPFGIQPIVRLAPVKDKIAHNDVGWSIQVSSKFSDKCILRGTTQYKLQISLIKEFIDLRVDSPATGCILVFTLNSSVASSKTQSSSFDVLRSDLVLVISKVVATANQRKNFSLSFSFHIENVLINSNFPWHYTVSLHQPQARKSIQLSGPLCSSDFSKVPVSIESCFLIDWGYRIRLNLTVESNVSGWILTSKSKPFDAFEVTEDAEQFNISAHLIGKVPVPSDEEGNEQILSIVLDELSFKFPHLQWTNSFISYTDNDKALINWEIRGVDDDIRKLCKNLINQKIHYNSSVLIIENPICNESLSPSVTQQNVTKQEIPWKSIGLIILVTVLMVPVCILFCIWPRREREIREKYQERLSRYAPTPEMVHKEFKEDDNSAFQKDTVVKSITTETSPVKNHRSSRSSIIHKADLVQLNVAHLEHPNVPEHLNNDDSSEDGPQRVHLLRSRPASKPTVVSPATAQYASVEAPSPDDSIENLARDILATPITITDTHKGLTAPMVTSLAKFRHTEHTGSRISVSSLGNSILIGGNAGTTLPEPQ